MPETSAPSSSSSAHEDEAAPSPSTVGNTFMRQYYHFLAKEPQSLHRFYKAESRWCHGLGSHMEEPIAGQRAINDQILKRGYAGARVDLDAGSIDCQNSLGGGVLVLVTGVMTLRSSPVPKPFVQTFFLAVQPKGYFVLNDCLRFLELPGASPVEVAPETAVVKDKKTTADKPASPAKNGKKTETQAPTSPAKKVVEKKTKEDQKKKQQQQKDEPVSSTSSSPVPASPKKAASSPVKAAATKTTTTTTTKKVVKEAAAPASPVKATATVASSPVKKTTTTTTTTTTTKPKEEDAKAKTPSPVKSPAKSPVKSPKKQEKAPAAAASPAPAAAPAAAPADPVIPAPAEPEKPKTWAALFSASKAVATITPPAAAAAVAAPVKPATPKAAAAPAAAPAPAAIAPATGAPAPEKSPKNKSGNGKEKEHKRLYSLFIRDVPTQARENDLRELFKGYGSIAGVSIPGQRGFGFVDFHEQESMRAALAETKEFKLFEKVLQVDERAERKEGQRGGFRGNDSRGRGRGHGPKGGRGERKERNGDEAPKSDRRDGARREKTGSRRGGKVDGASNNRAE